MIHRPIQLESVSLSFPHKTCFENFSTNVMHSSRIAIIGRNGSGKSSLLKMLQGIIEPTEGEIKVPEDVRMAYTPQVIEEFKSLSGGQRFNEALTQALALDPNVLLLDEPTNHLDASKRKSLMRMLLSYTGTTIIVSHDVELLRSCIDKFWHIDNFQIHTFSGNYDDYRREIGTKRAAIEYELSRLDRQKRDNHQALMKEQIRSAKSRAKGEKSIGQRKWPAIVSKAKALRAEETSGRKKSELNNKRQELTDKLSEISVPEIINPKFSLKAAEIGERIIMAVSEGSIGYDEPFLLNINLSIAADARIAITGDNGSGKSTLVKAILDDPSVKKTGTWHIPKSGDIGYLDQHYGTLLQDKTVLESVYELVPTWQHTEIRRHLNSFLFRKNEEVNAPIPTLSGGEKARLSLAQIAAKPPKLLILDEITNNLDLETRDYVIQVLKEYPGAMIVISHDKDLLQSLHMNGTYQIRDGTIRFLT